MFNKDILIYDIEATGIDVTQHEIIQLAAILLDKKTLKEKASFSSYIKPKNWDNRDPESIDINKITWEKLKKAPSLKTVLNNFCKQFKPTEVIPTTYGGNLDIIFFPAAFRSCKIKYPFDYHTLNFWALCYIFMATNKQLKNQDRFAGFTLEELAGYLKIKTPSNLHDALTDCRYEAEVFRKLIKHIK